MTDIVERLRGEGAGSLTRQLLSMGMWRLCDEAADEIVRLRFIFDLKSARADDEEMSLTENEVRYQNAALADENARLRSLVEELLSALAIQQEVQHITATET